MREYHNHTGFGVAVPEAGDLQPDQGAFKDRQLLACPPRHRSGSAGVQPIP